MIEQYFQSIGGREPPPELVQSTLSASVLELSPFAEGGDCSQHRSSSIAFDEEAIVLGITKDNLGKVIVEMEDEDGFRCRMSRRKAYLSYPVPVRSSYSPTLYPSTHMSSRF
jgi:hypothetical protein